MYLASGRVHKHPLQTPIATSTHLLLYRVHICYANAGV